MQSEIKRWGNSAAVQLSGKILTQAKLDLSSPISIEVRDGKTVIEALARTTKKIKLPFSEAQLLNGLDAYSARADEIAHPLPGEMSV